MAPAQLTADLLARKGSAKPASKWLHDTKHNINPMETSDWAQSPAPKPRLVTKSVRLNKQLNTQLKLLAIHTNKSQQSIMQEAVKLYLHNRFENAGCICGAEE